MVLYDFIPLYIVYIKWPYPYIKTLHSNATNKSKLSKTCDTFEMCVFFRMPMKLLLNNFGEPTP